MNIGIDIDGVIIDSESYFRYYAEIYDIKIGGNGAKGLSVKCQDRYDWTHEQTKEYWDQYVVNLQKEAPLMVGAKEVLNKLKEMGHNLFIISARGSIFEEELTNTQEWLEKEKLPVDGVFLKSINKLPVCKENDIDVMIDDSDINCRAISEGGIKCLYFRDVVGYDVSNPNVIEVHNWGEVLRYFASKK